MNPNSGSHLANFPQTNTDRLQRHRDERDLHTKRAKKAEGASGAASLTDFNASEALSFTASLSRTASGAASLTVWAASVTASAGPSEALCPLCLGWKNSFTLSTKPLKAFAGASGAGASEAASLTDFRASEALSFALSLSGTASAAESLTVAAASLAASGGLSAMLCALCSSGWMRSLTLSTKPLKAFAGASGAGASGAASLTDFRASEALSFALSLSGTASAAESLTVVAASLATSGGLSAMLCTLCSSGWMRSLTLSTKPLKAFAGASGAGASGAASLTDFRASEALSFALSLSGTASAAESLTVVAASLAASGGLSAMLCALCSSGWMRSLTLSTKPLKAFAGASSAGASGAASLTDFRASEALSFALSLSGTASVAESLTVSAASLAASAGASDALFSTTPLKALAGASDAGASGVDSPADFRASAALSTAFEVSGVDSLIALVASLAASVGFWAACGWNFSFRFSKKLEIGLDGASVEEEPVQQPTHMNMRFWEQCVICKLALNMKRVCMDATRDGQAGAQW
ncbi:MAG: hypothetical protein FRX49_12350 [Trebouxia sp. A1-2]|nr:MAG: hypothetical protein FRX49_12350 [Trebouxia sp. A1-2]